MKKIIFLVVLFLLLPVLSSAAINFTDGSWQTTFDCADWQTYGAMNCDGVTQYLASTCSQEGLYEQITSSANNVSGAGGKGQRHWYGSGVNNNSGGTNAEFGASYDEIWIRWYQRYDSNMTIGQQHTNKMLYFGDSSKSTPNALVFGFDGVDSFRVWVVGNDVGPDIYQSSAGYGWNSLISDGGWHSYELYMKLDTNNTDGILRAWIDGNMVLNSTTADNGITANGGWDSVLSGSNHKFFTQTACMANDIDDMAISVTTPPNTDASGNAFIGPIGWDGSATQPPPPPVELPATVLFDETFENSNFTGRGWYDSTNPVLNPTEVISGSSNSVEYLFLTGATTPTSGGAMRKKITETDSVYVSYNVKYSDNWQGSNQSYHPHEFYLMTNMDNDWVGMAYTHLTAYIEQNGLRPQLAIQDGVNIDLNNLNTNLVGVTENRSVAGCNGDSDGSGNGSCYSAGNGTYWNWKQWQVTTPVISKGTWHKVEAYFKLNSVAGGIGVADGVMQYWLDGQKLIDTSNVVFRTGQHPDMMFNQLAIAPWIGDGSPIEQTFWIDDLTVATAPPQSQDVTLTPPSGFHITSQN